MSLVKSTTPVVRMRSPFEFIPDTTGEPDRFSTFTQGSSTSRSAKGILCYVLLHYVIVRCVMLRCVIVRCVISRYVVLHYVVLR